MHGLKRPGVREEMIYSTWPFPLSLYPGRRHLALSRSFSLSRGGIILGQPGHSQCPLAPGRDQFIECTSPVTQGCSSTVVQGDSRSSKL